MKVIHHIIIVISFVGYIFCQNSNDLDETLQRIKAQFDATGEKLENTRKRLENSMHELQIRSDNFNEIQQSRAVMFQNALKEKCEKNGAGDVMKKLKGEQENIKFCIESHVNLTTVRQELQQARATGSVGEVLGRYCKIWSSIYSCFDNVISIVKSCLNENEKDTFDRLLDIVNELQEYTCFKDGEHAIMFLAKGGPECVQERIRGIQYCLNATWSRSIRGSGDTSKEIPSLEFSSSDCEEIDILRKCMNTELENCRDSTPANIVDEMFQIVKKHMPCNGAPSGCWSLTTASVLLVVTFLIHLKM